MPFDTSTLQVGDLSAFAVANGMTYSPTAAPSGFGGALFEFLQGSSVSDRFASSGRPILEIGTITGTVGGSQIRQSGSWTVTTSYGTTSVRSFGFLAIQLERAVPHLVLDAKSNGSSIPMPIAGGQSLSLEGDFDRHFTLYCPAGYERDALYIFTPDLMALLIDESGAFDVEIVDDMMFIYSNVPFDPRDIALWDRLGRIRDLVGGKTLTQTDYYSDERVADRAANRVADDGRRLRMGFLPRMSTGLKIGIVAGVVVFIGIFVTIFAVVYSLVFR